MWILTVMSLWTAGAMAQEECAVDEDCTGGQYCYEISKMCVDHTVCSRYNRQESSQPSRRASQCGKCLDGYSAAKLTLDAGGEAESCTQDLNAVVRKDQSITTAVWVSASGSIFFGIIFFGGLVLFVVYVKFRCRFPRKDKPNTELEKPCLVMVKNGDCESVLTASSHSENIRNDKYSDADETHSISTTREYCGNLKEESCRPVMAQGYHPPYYVRTDSSYDPGDNQTVQTTFSQLPDNEETNPSDHETSGPPTGAATTITVPFASIAQAESENTTNTNRERLGFPSTSNSQEGHEIRLNNGIPEPNNPDGNGPRNLNSIFIVQMVKLYTNFNQGRNGS